MDKKIRRVTDSDIRTIVSELDRWALGELGSKISWSKLEERFGFSRQTLQAKPEIKSAFDNAKTALRGGLVKSKEQASSENVELNCEIRRLNIELEDYKRKELLWLERWQRIAFHVRNNGMQMKDMDKLIPDGGDKPTQRKTADILRPFDKDIPPTGRI